MKPRPKHDKRVSRRKDIIMKQNHGYELDYVNNTITVTKSFLKEAGIVGSAAYTALAQMRRDYPDFTIQQREIAKKPGKKSYGKLTYKVMGEFIAAQEEDNAAAVLAEFKHVQQLSKVMNGSYAYVKTWFLKRYEDAFSQKNETDEQEA